MRTVGRNRIFKGLRQAADDRVREQRAKRQLVYGAEGLDWRRAQHERGDWQRRVEHLPYRGESE